VRLIRPDSTRKLAVCGTVTLDEIGAAIGTASGKPVVNPVGTMLKVHQALQASLNEIFFTKVLILVEGLEDVAYISTYLTLLNRWDDFRKLGCHLVPAGGKSSIAQPLAIAQHLKIPTFVLFDSDGHSDVLDASDDAEKAKKKQDRRSKHQNDNTTILTLCAVTRPEPFPAATLWCHNTVMWNSEIGAVVADDIGRDKWITVCNKVRNEHGIDVGDINKNSLFIGFFSEFSGQYPVGV